MSKKQYAKLCMRCRKRCKERAENIVVRCPSFVSNAKTPKKGITENANDFRPLKSDDFPWGKNG